MTSDGVLVEVAPGVHVATSQVYTTTSTVVVGDEGGCLVVDPGVTAREVEALGDAVRARGWHPVAVWSTHPHWDHRLDGPWLRGVPRWSAPSGNQPDEPARAHVPVARFAAQRDDDDELARALHARPADAPAAIAPEPRPAPVRPGGGEGVAAAWHTLDDEAIGWSGPRALVLAHRAHAAGHSALLLPDVGVLIAGDMLSDIEIPLLDDDAADPVGDYRTALDVLATCGATLVVPGHGSVGRELDARVTADRAYLTALAGGAEPDDPRLAAPAQRAAHEQQRILVAHASHRTPPGG